MLFNYFDWFIFLLILIFNFGVWKYKFLNKFSFLGYLFFFLLFFLIIPIVTIDIELAYAKKEFPMSDGFNLIYTILRFPTWWFIGILEFLFLQYFKNYNL